MSDTALRILQLKSDLSRVQIGLMTENDKELLRFYRRYESDLKEDVSMYEAKLKLQHQRKKQIYN